MPVTAPILAELMAAGLSGEALLDAVRRIDAAEMSAMSTGKSASHERRKAWDRDRKRLKRSANSTAEKVDIPPENGAGVYLNTPLDITEKVERQTPGADNSTVAVQRWNAMASRCGLSQVAKLSDQRRKKLTLRLGEIDGLGGWDEVLDRIETSDFLRGSTGWVASFDWVIEPKNITKIIEGNYVNREGVKTNGNGSFRDSLAGAYSILDQQRERSQAGGGADLFQLPGLRENSERVPGDHRHDAHAISRGDHLPDR